MNKKKRVVVISDLHCGSEVGLTPPSWQYNTTNRNINKHNKFAELQRLAWKWYRNELKKLGPIDVCLCLGDCVDGQDKKGAGAGQITTDLETQAEMAIESLIWIKAKKYNFVYGSGYHVTSEGIDIENHIARYFNAGIGNHAFIDVNSTIFNIKHKSSRSSIPHGRGTLLHKQKLWEQMWSDYKNFPKSDILLRGHAHYYYAIQDTKYLMMSCPCMKTLGDKYGGRNFIDLIDYGFLHFDIQPDGSYDWTVHIANFERQKQKILKF